MIHRSLINAGYTTPSIPRRRRWLRMVQCRVPTRLLSCACGLASRPGVRTEMVVVHVSPSLALVLVPPRQ